MTRSYRFVATIAVMAAACIVINDRTTDAAAVRTAINQNDRNFERWVAAGAVDSIVSGYYAPDAIDFEPNAEPNSGSDAIRTMWRGYVAMGTIRAHLELKDVVVADSIAVDHGTYRLEIRARPPADTNTVLATDHGSYVTTFIRRNGQWRALYDIGASAVPAAPAPATTQ